MNALPDLQRDLRRLAAALLALFGVIAFTTAFWAVLGSGWILARQDNARNVVREQLIARGAIIDRDGVILAQSVPDEVGVMQRHYADPALSGAVGYYSVTYGTAGLEAAYDAELRGDTLRSAWARFFDRVLHRTDAGSDLRATLDLNVQIAAAGALGDRAGAVVVVDVPSGAILGMVSQPGYNPNTFDEHEAELEADPTTPLLNRVTAGLYQPGGALQPIVLAALLGADLGPDTSATEVLNAPISAARSAVTVGDLSLACLDGAPDRVQTWAEAFVYGCPAPFADAFAGSLTPQQLAERVAALGLLDPPALTGFETAAGPRPRALTTDSAPAQRVAALVGQCDLTVTPLHMVEVVAAVANRGNGVPLHMADAVRAPDAETWEPLDIPTEHPALLRADVAAAVRLAMLQAAAQNPHVRRAARGDLVLYGHAALSYAGPDETPYAWFLGFVDVSEGSQSRAVAVVVVIEDEDDPGAAAHVAGEAFAAATR